MALTRKMLKAMGIDEEKIEQILDAHMETFDSIKAERDQFKAEAEKLPTVQKQLDEMKAAAEKDGKDPYKVKYEAIKEEFNNFKNDITAKETKAKKEEAYKALLKEVGVSEKRIDAILKVTDLDGSALTEDGKFENASELKKSIKTEWADFIVTSGKQGADTPNPPAGGGKVYKTKDEIMAIRDTAERQQAIADNHELFGF